MLRIADLTVPESEIELSAVRSAGPGGQNVNKVATAIHLRFDLANSGSVPDDVRQRLLASGDSRITADGIVVIKAQRYRSQDKNRRDALARLTQLIESGFEVQKPRKPTRPTRAAREKRLDDKAHRSRLKQSRGKIVD